MPCMKRRSCLSNAAIDSRRGAWLNGSRLISSCRAFAAPPAERSPPTKTLSNAMSVAASSTTAAAAAVSSTPCSADVTGRMSIGATTVGFPWASRMGVQMLTYALPSAWPASTLFACASESMIMSSVPASSTLAHGCPCAALAGRPVSCSARAPHVTTRPWASIAARIGPPWTTRASLHTIGVCERSSTTRAVMSTGMRGRSSVAINAPASDRARPTAGLSRSVALGSRCAAHRPGGSCTPLRRERSRRSR